MVDHREQAPRFVREREFQLAQAARALAIIVASPDLIRVSFRTPQQMVLANALCQAWETGG
jgi:hypothetical protein